LENSYSVLLGECNVLVFVMCLSNNWVHFPKSVILKVLLYMQVIYINSLGCAYRHILVD
jgi:hypothetical protein